MATDRRPATTNDTSPLRLRWDAFTAAFRDFWRGYWSAAQMSCG